MKEENKKQIAKLDRLINEAQNQYDNTDEDKIKWAAELSKLEGMKLRYKQVDESMSVEEIIKYAYEIADKSLKDRKKEDEIRHERLEELLARIQDASDKRLDKVRNSAEDRPIDVHRIELGESDKPKV